MANANENVNPEPMTEDLPEPQITGKPAGQSYEPASGSSVTLEAVEQMLDRKLQSIKDTRLGKMEAKLSDLEGAFAAVQQLKAAGMSDAQAQSKVLGEKRIQDLESEIQSLKTGKEVPVASPGGGAQNWKNRQASILSEAGIKSDDPRVIEMLRKENFQSHDAYLDALTKRANDWSFADAKKPQPSPSTIAQTVPAVVAGDGSYTKEKYAEDMLANRGNKTKLAEIKAKAQADGVDVNNIGFNL